MKSHTYWYASIMTIILILATPMNDGRTGHFIALYQRYIFIVFWKDQDGRTGHFNNILSTLFTSPNSMSSLRAMYRFMILCSHQNGRCSAILIFSRKYILYVTKHYFSIQNTSSKLPKYKLTIPNHLPVTCGKMSPKWPMFSQLEFSLKISIIQLSRLVVFNNYYF
jgi:hypothetical protein